MKILVTGGAGFIGSHVVDRFIEAGHDVAVVDNLTTGDARWVNPRARLHVVDLRSARLADVFEKERPEVVSHLAAQASVGRSVTDPIFDASVNVVGGLGLLECCRRFGVRRIIYLGGLGDDADPKLSPHLRSRHEVGKILRESGVETIEFRASLVIGTGSLSFDLVKALTDRLPVMLCPRWLTTPTQPIAVDDVLGYLLAAKDLPPGGSRIFEIGGTDVSSYGDLIREYARQRGLRRWLISVPVLTPYLSGLWLALVTPSSFEVGRHLIEGLKNPTVVRDRTALDVFPIRPMGIREAIQKAIEAEKPERRTT